MFKLLFGSIVLGGLTGFVITAAGLPMWVVILCCGIVGYAWGMYCNATAGDKY